MTLVSISGSRSLLQGLLNVEGLQISYFSATEEPPGTWRVTAYANEDALAEVRRRGCFVVVVMTAEQVQNAINAGRAPGAAER